MTLIASDFDTESVAMANSIRELLTREGIPKKEHSKKLVELLGLSLSQIHRKLNGSNWELSQIRLISDYFGVEYDSLNRRFNLSKENNVNDLSQHEETSLTRAILILDNRKFRCNIQLGSALHITANMGYVAYLKGEEWEVCEGSSTVPSVQYFKVNKIELVIPNNKKIRVAVLDDDAICADALSDYLTEVGFHVEVFYDLDTINHETINNSGESFSAYILDWLINKTTSETLIKNIRLKSPNSSIILMTGKITSGITREKDIAKVMVEYNASLYEKPTRLAIIAAQLKKELAI